MVDYPKKYEDNLRYRADILQKAHQDLKFQAVLKESCRRSILFLYNTFYHTYDPRKPDKVLPFITYPYQDEFVMWDLECLAKEEDNFIEKSRDMGATWLLVGNDLHQWLFEKERIEIRWGSRKEQYVDYRGDMDAIFPKFRFLLRHLPIWLLPQGFRWKEHDNSMRLINPETGSSITGEATNEKFGRGGRKLRVRLDEFAFWDCDEQAWEGIADVTKCRTAVSTPNGSANKFAQLAKGEEIKNKLSLHWTLHPEKVQGAYYWDKEKRVTILPDQANELHKAGIKVRSDWYDKECARRSSRSVAQELDIDYLRSGNPFFDLIQLSKQKKWEYFKRQTPNDDIPYGRFIKIRLVDVRGKIEVREREDGNIQVFELPQPLAEYVIGSDTAEGLLKGDQCFAVVRNKWSRNVCATVHLNCTPEEFVLILHVLEKFYNDARQAPENNNHGYTVCKELNEKGSNLYRSKNLDSNQGVIKRGFSTTPRTRPLVLDRLEEEVRKNSCELRCPVLISQFETFIYNENTGKPEADGDFLDDGVIACAISGFVIDEEPYKAKADTDYKRRAAVEDMRRHKNAGFSFGG